MLAYCVPFARRARVPHPPAGAAVFRPAAQADHLSDDVAERNNHQALTAESNGEPPGQIPCHSQHMKHSLPQQMQHATAATQTTCTQPSALSLTTKCTPLPCQCPAQHT
jgi:hypothetical protein